MPPGGRGRVPPQTHRPGADHRRRTAGGRGGDRHVARGAERADRGRRGPGRPASPQSAVPAGEEARERLGLLAERELEVALAVGRGLTNAQIADVLCMSVLTVKSHISHIFTKLDLGNRVQIALLAHRSGLA
ncbi:response regulator transcription factor [Streptomyces sp. NPDC003952]